MCVVNCIEIELLAIMNTSVKANCCSCMWHKTVGTSAWETIVKKIFVKNYID